ncbi:MAG: class I SAM-dependent DNA methyltransferase, partial [Chloroflexi bacterium]|nr:class I SAM-dependent DNA methyltransferase [Chloroflexota bacterium]
KGNAKRAGLLATQGIRGGANRTVLERIKNSGNIFWAQSDRNWYLNGAAVHVSMIGFDNGIEKDRLLDNHHVPNINSDLTGASDLTSAKPLDENKGICYLGTYKIGSFDIDSTTAMKMISLPKNPNGRSNSDVVRPWVNGLDITRRNRNMWIIDFSDMTEGDASFYEAPFEYVKRVVKPERDNNNRERRKKYWWQHGETSPGMHAAIDKLSRFVGTPSVAKYRLFTWLSHPTIPDHQIVVFARNDDYFFGVMQSKAHELWARATGTQLREAESGFRYTPTTTFETFPFPFPLGKEPKSDKQVKTIAEVAKELVEQRDHWLNPEGASEAELKKRTLTNLYNERPTWLDLAHKRLDEAVFAAYRWESNLSDDEILARLLALNLERSK